eukprot:maker-scaffold483_size159862-snap-gene-0.43 protein:Tk08699 transcript:maker-scaffold483_size159862-snap-gene-0.43-mRNA-1 annotation:"hypothetical protein L798_10696"
MLTRKLSVTGEFSTALADYGPDETLSEGNDIVWTNRSIVRKCLRALSLLSLISVILNTPKTFDRYSSLMYVTYLFDLFCAFIFLLEMITKIRDKGLMSRDSAYLKDRWCQFDAVMLFFLCTSIILQTLEIWKVAPRYSPLSIIRAPRPLIMIRFIRVFLKFSMPKSRINQIFKRSSQQIYNVTIFFLFFMSLYGLLGVQFFGELNYHCVRSGVKAERVTINDLTIPDSYCNPNPDSGGQGCPKGFDCIKLSSLGKSITGFTGFGEFLTSVFTVYQAASQEGWVYIMYRAADSVSSWKAVFYFTTMIFFLAWMVRNVFIAVITETFNEIRVQFQEMWGERERLEESDHNQVLNGNAKAWKLVTVYDNENQGYAPKVCQNILTSPVYHIFVMIVTLTNAATTASISFKHTRDEKPREYFFEDQQYLEFWFTMLFNFEVVFKMLCLGVQSYFTRTIHKFEFLLAVTTTIHILPFDGLFLSWMSIFQVLRVVRLIKASPMLEDFVYKIFGPGRKLGSLIIFTMCLLVITSSISMQLFCCLRGLDKFETFPYAFMSMFQILTQEAWPEVMSRTMEMVDSRLTFVVAVYFSLYHLFVTLIVMSLFVAVILDNLELDEDAKKVKQLKMREESSDIKEDLPLRLKIFERFPQRPRFCLLNRTPSEYPTPKVRESFVTKFVYDSENSADILDITTGGHEPGFNNETHASLRYRKKSNNPCLLSSPIRRTFNSSVVKKSSVSNIIWSVRRSLRGSQLFNKRGGTYRINDSSKENGYIPGMNTITTNNRPQNIDIKLLHAKKQQAEMRRNQKEEDLRENHPYFDRPLFAVPRESTFRKICQTLKNAQYDATLKDPVTGKERKVRFKTFHKLMGLVTYLDWTMIIITTLAMLSMTMETPEFRAMDNSWLQIMDYVFVIGMGLELTLKVLADGMLFTPKALVKDVSGILDLFIFCVSVLWIGWMPEQVEPNSVAQMVMILRCCRPLRIFILVPHMRKVVHELCRGFKEIFLVAVLLLVLIFIFATYGVHLYGLRFASCNDVNIKTRDDCTSIFRAEVFVTKMNIPLKSDCPPPGLYTPRVWMNPRRFNFDNIRNSMLALFEVLSFKGWVDLRDVIITRMGMVSAVYIHMYVFLGSMIGLTLFVGVVIANYRENKGTALLTVDQMRWSDLKKRLKIAQPLHVPPRPENSRFQSFIYDIVQHLYFKRLIAALVLLNSFLLCVKWEEEEDVTFDPDGMVVSNTTTTLDGTMLIRNSLATASSALTICFLVEVIMKMIAFTPYGYWQSRRNRGDLLVTVLGVIWIILNHAIYNEYTLTLGYVVIILRFFTITGKHATLKMLMQTVFVSMFKSFFIIMGMFLLITVYALAGVILFGSVKYGEAINRQANFRTAWYGMSMLFRTVTGEDWNRVLHDCMLSPPYCTHQAGASFWETDCGNVVAAIIYFCSFYVIITYIVLNLLVAIIMENFSLFYSNEEDALLSYADIRNFQNTWNIVDVNQRGMIPVRRVKFILRLLKGRLEVDPQKDNLLFKHMCYELERLHNGEDVTFHDVLSMLSYRSVDIRKALQLEELLAREELEYLIEEEVAKITIRNWLDGCLRRIRDKEQSLIAGLRAMNDPVLNALKPLEELEQENDDDWVSHTRTTLTAAETEEKWLPMGTNKDSVDLDDVFKVQKSTVVQSTQDFVSTFVDVSFKN